MRLKKDKPAPFDGVLVPPSNYKNYQTLEEQNNAIMVQLSTNGLDKVEPEEPVSPWALYLLWFTVGVGAGAMAFGH